jgi:phage terminase large subunit-like protein
VPNSTASNNSKKRKILTDNLNEYEQALYSHDWREWARVNQLPPGGAWDGWLILAGRGWGKTRVGAEFVRAEVQAGRAKRVGLVAETSADGRDVIVEGESGILAVSPPWERPAYEPSKRRLTWKNGAIATLYDAREPDQLRGPQHDLVWFDELAKFRYAEAVFDQAMFGLRIGAFPRWIATTTPRPIALIRRLASPSPLVGEGGRRSPEGEAGRKGGIVVTRGKSDENLAHIAASFRANVIERYQGTRLGRQELDAEILDDVPGALWSRRALDESRVQRAPTQLMRIVVGVDPAASSGESANETGIIAGGIAQNGHAYVLEDWSLRGSPDKWARSAVAAYRKHEADCLVAEANQGGEMVEQVIRSVADVPVKLVRATRGKYVRAEPISALYEQGRVHHVGVLPELEDQMIAFTPDCRGPSGLAMTGRSESPDRVDALVWMLTELFPDITAGEERPRVPPPLYDTGGWMI